MARSFTLRNIVITGAFCAAYVMSASSSTTQETPGQLVFNNACRTCHTIKEGDNRLGPNLYKIVGRKAGSLQNYGYSSAMKGADFVWDEAKLDQFIANPEQIVPGNNMKPFSGLASADDRAKVIAFLLSLSKDEQIKLQVALANALTHTKGYAASETRAARATARARSKYSFAFVESRSGAATIVAPTNIAMRKRLMIVLAMLTHARSSAPPRGSMLARSSNKTRALCCREITRGLARGGNTTVGGFLFDTHSPTQIIVITGVRRGQGLARETLRQENPERGSRTRGS
jgi:cytochrome c